MDVRLTPELERLIRKEVASGRYADAGEVVREALRLFASGTRSRADRLARLRESLETAIAEADRGELLDGATVVREARATLRGGRRRPRPTE